MEAAKKVADLKPADYNPRVITDEQLLALKSAMQAFGDLSGIVVNIRTGNIVGGHQRIKAFDDSWIIHAKAYTDDVGTVKAGYIETEYGRWSYREVDWDEDKEKSANIAANKHGGDWDKIILAELLADLPPEYRELTGFSAEETSKLIDQLDPHIDEDDDIAPEAPQQPITQVGDIYELGNHRLMVGDSTNFEHVEKLMNGQKAEMVWTDPPYNVDYEGKNGLKIENDNMDKDQFYQFLYDAFVNMNTVLQEGGAAYIAHADSEGRNFRNAFEDAGFDMKQCIIWVKNSMVLGRQDYQWQHEPILYGWKPGAPHRWYGEFNKKTVLDEEQDIKKLNKNQLVALVNKYRNSENTSVVREAKPKTNDSHPTMKPVELIMHFLKNSSKANDIVLDLFGGSGSTLMAAENTGRKCYTMELDPKYADVIITRWEKKTGSKAQKI